ncbi:hypothetical protein TcCL_NonESM10164 [Trypanosoma cruzi]|nr:hypothetical protein TcCL_NonESM10164 [Trypanosoma cruzi]
MVNSTSCSPQCGVMAHTRHHNKRQIIAFHRHKHGRKRAFCLCELPSKSSRPQSLCRRPSGRADASTAADRPPGNETKSATVSRGPSSPIPPIEGRERKVTVWTCLADRNEGSDSSRGTNWTDPPPNPSKGAVGQLPRLTARRTTH